MSTEARGAGLMRPTSSGHAGYLPTLDGWRAVAIVMVLASHAARSIRESWGINLSLEDLGTVGVRVFFAISGFLICTRLLSEYQNAHCLRDFYIRRAHRILPPYLVFLCALALLGLSGAITLSFKDWSRAALMVANYGHGQGWYVAHCWSLSMEEHFYVLFPLLLVACGPRRGLAVTVGLAVLVGAWRGVDLATNIARPTWGLPTWRTDSACDGLLWGCVFAMLFARYPKRLRQLCNPLTCALLVIGCAVLFRSGWEYTFSVVTAIAFPVLLIGTVARPAGIASRLLEQPALRWIGRLSYSLYLWQEVFLVLPTSRQSMLGVLQDWPLNIVCAFGCAMASYYLIEKPFIRQGYRATNRAGSYSTLPVASYTSGTASLSPT